MAASVGRRRMVTEVTRAIVRKHRPDYQIVLFMGLLLLIGLIVLFAISPYQINYTNANGGSLDQTHYMLKQLIYLAVGLIAFVVTATVPVTWWKQYSVKLVVAGLGICLLLALLGAVGLPPAFCYNGACRWYTLGPLSFQPAEFLKFGVVIFAAVFLARRMAKQQVNDVSSTLVPLAMLLGAAALLVIGFQKDMGTGITLFGSIAAMIFIAGLSRRLLITSLATLGGVGVLFIITSPHRMERVMTFFSSGGSAESYHINMATIAIGSGGLTGKGLGNSIQTFGYLPEAMNDSIFAVLGETFGFVGLIIIIGLFVALLRRLIKIIPRLEDLTMRLMVAGIFGWLATHVVVNIGAMIGIFPLTGVTLPFLSLGGTSLIFMMAALGIAYRASRFTTHQSLTTGEQHETSRRGRGVGRSRDAGPRRYQRA